MDMVKIQI